MLTHSPGCLLILEIFQNSDIRKQFFSLEKKWVCSPKTYCDWHFRNPSALWWGHFAEIAKFLVLDKMSVPSA